jgi:bifunctional DNA-binding transcriptional regulator/antitoxin component of YhaV-PrlF toxin-antitoxin module
MYQSKYVFPCHVISGNRVTIPDSVVKAWNIKKGQTLKITFELDKPELKGIVI